MWRGSDQGARPFNLLGWFSALSFLCIAAISAVSGEALARFLTERLLLREAVVSMEFIEGLTKKENILSYFVRNEPGRTKESLEGFFVEVSRLPNVVRANAYSSDRSIIWSSDSRMTSRRLLPNVDLERAFDGVLQVHLIEIGAGTKIEHAHFGSEFHGYDFVETYIPIWSRDGANVVGVIELYKLPEALLDAIRSGRMVTWSIATFGGLIVYTSLFWIVWRASVTIRRQRDSLVACETMATVGELASAVAHGIRNPLSSIRSSAELALDEDLETSRQSAHNIIRECDTLDGWITNLLTLAHADSGSPIQLDLNDLVRDCLKALRPSLSQNRIEILAEYRDDLPPVQANADALFQAVTSILRNAVEAMRDGGSLCIRTDLVSKGREVQLTAIDSGPGMDAATLDRVSEPFFTTKESGLGLGILLAKRIITRCGGEIAFASVAGQGTEARIRLPAVDASRPV